MIWNFPGVHYFFLNAGSNFRNKTNGDSDVVISGRPKIKKKPPIPFIHLIFLSLHTDLRPSFPLFIIPHIHGRVLYALRTGMRFPNLTLFSPFWYGLEVKATHLDKAYCLDSIISYYSLLRTWALPKGRLSPPLCRTAATRGCWGTRTEPCHPSLDSGCQQLRDTLSWLWPLERHQ